MRAAVVRTTAPALRCLTRRTWRTTAAAAATRCVRFSSLATRRKRAQQALAAATPRSCVPSCCPAQSCTTARRHTPHHTLRRSLTPQVRTRILIHRTTGGVVATGAGGGGPARRHHRRPPRVAYVRRPPSPTASVHRSARHRRTIRPPRHHGVCRRQTAPRQPHRLDL